MLGKDVAVTTVDGEVVAVKIPAAVQFGERVRLEGKGMPNLHTGTRGAMVIEVMIRTVAITAEHQNLVNEIVNLLPPSP